MGDWGLLFKIWKVEEKLKVYIYLVEGLESWIYCVEYTVCVLV